MTRFVGCDARLAPNGEAGNCPPGINQRPTGGHSLSVLKNALASGNDFPRRRASLYRHTSCTPDGRDFSGIAISGLGLADAGSVYRAV
jgi:hypothetical protein